MKNKNIIAIIGFALAFVISGCGDNDPASTSNNQNTDPNDPVTVTIRYQVRFNEDGDELSLFAVSAVYTNADGQDVTVPLTENSWTQELSGVSLPFTANLTLLYQKKDEYPDKATYKTGRGFAITYTTSNGKGRSESYSPSTATNGRDTIEELRTSIVSKSYTKQEKIAKDGSPVN
jgi:hypothetical protein